MSNSSLEMKSQAYLEPFQTCKIGRFLTVHYFRKTLHLRCLIEFLKRFWQLSLNLDFLQFFSQNHLWKLTVLAMLHTFTESILT